MTVRELIERLGTMPPEAVVVVNLECNELANGCTVKTVAMKHVRLASDGQYHSDYYPDIDDDSDRPQSQVVDVTA